MISAIYSLGGAIDYLIRKGSTKWFTGKSVFGRTNQERVSDYYKRLAEYKKKYNPTCA